jgi:prophage tail gpP-like protein
MGRPVTVDELRKIIIEECDLDLEHSDQDKITLDGLLLANTMTTVSDTEHTLYGRGKGNTGKLVDSAEIHEQRRKNGTERELG